MQKTVTVIEFNNDIFLSLRSAMYLHFYRNENSCHNRVS